MDRLLDVEKYHQQVEGLTHGFRPFSHKYQNFEISLKYESLGEGINSCSDFNRFTTSLDPLFEVEKYDDVKG